MSISTAMVPPPAQRSSSSAPNTSVVSRRLRVLVVGHHELDYPRNVINQRLMRALGHELSLAHSLAPSGLREIALFWSTLRNASAADVIFLTEGSHRHTPLVKLAARLAGKPLVFDAFTSRYNTYVEDRKLYAPRSLQALRCWLLDWMAMRSADAAVFDTAEHRAYFELRYGLPAVSEIIEVGVDEGVFAGIESGPERAAAQPVEVLFYGTYIPLQGVEHIVAAAEALASESFRFTLIGRGQTRPRIEQSLAHKSLPNLVLREPLPAAALGAELARADIVLGIFGDSLKAANVVPNKVVQAAAAGKAIVTRQSPAIERYFQAGRDAVLVPAADPAAIAAALRELAQDRSQRLALGRNARQVFERHFCERALSEKMARVLEAVLPAQPDA